MSMAFVIQGSGAHVLAGDGSVEFDVACLLVASGGGWVVSGTDLPTAGRD